MARLVVQQRVGFLASSDDGDSPPHGLVCIRRPGPVVLIEPLIRHNEADLPIRLPPLPSRHGLPHHPIAPGEGLPPPSPLVAGQDAAPALPQTAVYGNKWLSRVYNGGCPILQKT